jgi:hypothetical protein
MDSSIELYEHQPIDRDSDEFRLVRLVDVDTVIFHANLGNPPGYRALSYTWGEQTKTMPLEVLIDGSTTLQSRRMEVTVNCMGALKRLFEDDSSTPVWIDAICIDQKNNSERNHQVGLMSKIYSSANKVQIDLGEGDENTRKALAYVVREYECLDTGLSPLIHFPYTDHAPKTIQRSIKEILSRPWFRRRWVLQEVHFAQYAEVLCGNDKITWKALRLLGRAITNRGQRRLARCP